MTPDAAPRRIAVVAVPRELVTGNRQHFKQTLLDHLNEGEDVIIDFGDAMYVDSSGLGALISVANKFRTYGGQLLVCGLGRDMTSLFELTKLDSCFTMYADVDAATRALRELA